MPKLLCKVLNFFLGGNAQMAPRDCAPALFDTVVESLNYFMLSATTRVNWACWWLGLYLLAIIHPEMTLLLQETVPNCVFNMRSTHGFQFNQIQCGKVKGAASPSTLAFSKND